jgi:hypothetical protein
MVSDGHILEFIWRSQYESPSNVGLNVFHYQVEVAAPFNLLDYGQDICNEWYNSQVILLQPITSTIVSWHGLTINNLSTPAEFWEGVSDDQSSGAVSGDCLPPYAAWAFILRRTTKVTRNGSKRFWGVPESMQLNGVPTAGAGLLLPGIADALGASMPFTAIGSPAIDLILEPRIVRKNALGEMTLSQAVYDGQFRQISTQNSRKFGRGM